MSVTRSGWAMRCGLAIWHVALVCCVGCRAPEATVSPSAPPSAPPGGAMVGLAMIRDGASHRASSYDVSGGNGDAWSIQPGQSRVLADIKGPGIITHIWMTQRDHYRQVLLKITWDDASSPSVLVPLGDFFCLGNELVNSFDSALFSASTGSPSPNQPYNANVGCGLNCYVPMPFRKRAVIELVNQSTEKHTQYFYIDYETSKDIPPEMGYFHAEFRRFDPFGGWGPKDKINTSQRGANKERLAWDNNYVILETKGRGQYIGCNLSVSNFSGNWWGEGDDMIWVDGYKWPPDLHGTGSEDYFNQGWGMQANAFRHNGSSIWERRSVPPLRPAASQPGTSASTQSLEPRGGLQTSYMFHLENPVRFQKEIKVTIENGHANQFRNEFSSVAYWYADKPTPIIEPPPVQKRMPIPRDAQGRWLTAPDTTQP